MNIVNLTEIVFGKKRNIIEETSSELPIRRKDKENRKKLLLIDVH
jgi:hypothetical protein